MGWYKRPSRLIFVAFRRYSSKKNTLIKTPIQESSFSRTSFYTNTSNPSFNRWRVSSLSHPIFSHSAKSVQCHSPLLNGAKRFYFVDRDHFFLFEELIKKVLVGILSIPLVILGIYGLVIYIEHLEIVPYTYRSRLIILSSEDEKEIGKQMLKERKAFYGEKLLPSHHPQSIKVQRIARKIIKANRHWDSERLDWEFIVVDKPIVNAYCMPGGKIVVFTGLLKHLKSDAEIATVIGHEVAHAMARHAAETFQEYWWWYILTDTLDQFLTPVILEGIIHLLQYPLTTTLELEADEVGLMLMASAGYDPKVAPVVVLKLEGIAGNWFTLGFTAERVEALYQPEVMLRATWLYWMS